MAKISPTQIKFAPLTPSLLPQYLIWFNSPQVRRFLLPSTPKTGADIRSWLNQIQNHQLFRYFAILAGNQPIGHIGLKFHQSYAEVGLVIGEPNYWHRGIGTLSLKFICGQIPAGITRLTASIHPQNTHSIRLFTRAGFCRTASGTKWPVFSQNLAPAPDPDPRAFPQSPVLRPALIPAPAG